MTTTQRPVLSDLTYRIEKELGSGGGGIVYKAWHTRLQKHVVIKELRRGAAHAVEVQRTEVEALKNVKSAFLPQVFDIITEGGRVFTVIEFIEGESFDKCLERGERFTQPQIVKWYGQLASALEEIHSRGIYHRDIKPANVMLTPGGDACLIDFNAALVNGNDAGIVSRSLGYASPEQYEIFDSQAKRHKGEVGDATSAIGVNLSNASVARSPIGCRKTERAELLADPEVADRFATTQSTELIILPIEDDRDMQGVESVDAPVAEGIDWKRSDIYSLGATMYHLLTGRRPDERAAQVIPISELGRFDGWIVYVIERSMRLMPSDRFASGASLVKAMQNAQSRWKSTRLGIALSGVILSLLFIISVGVAIFGSGVIASEEEMRYYATVQKEQELFFSQQRENETRYESAMYEIENGRNPHTAYETALEIFDDRIDPYYSLVTRLWDNGDIIACRSFVEENMSAILDFHNAPDAKDRLREIHMIAGNCFFLDQKEPMYTDAKKHFERAGEHLENDPVGYRNYIISLARTGHIEKAEEMLADAGRPSFDNATKIFLRGEIDFLSGDYYNAIASLSMVISQSNDDFLLYRAYYISDEIYKRLGQSALSVALLSEPFRAVPRNQATQMTQRLAEAYMGMDRIDEAIETLGYTLERFPDNAEISAMLEDQMKELERAFFVNAASGIAKGKGCIFVYEDRIYYANFNDENKLYSMKTDGTDKRKLSDDSATYLCVLNDKVYYTSESNHYTLSSINIDGSGRTVFAGTISAEFCVIGNTIYFSGWTAGLHKIRPGEVGMSQVNNVISTNIDIVDGVLYYANGVDGYRLYAMDLLGNKSEWRRITDDETAYAAVSDGQIFYSNAHYDKRLYSINADGSNKQKLCDDIVGVFVISDDRIVYNSLLVDNHGLYVINTDGSGRIKITDDEVPSLGVSMTYESKTDSFGWLATFCVSDGVVYYINRSDGNKLYSIQEGGSGRRALE